MENNDVNGAIPAATTSVMAVGMLVMEDESSSSQIPRVPRGERDFESHSRIAFFILKILIVSIKYVWDHKFSLNCVEFLCQIIMLHETVNVSIKEQLLVFCHILGHNVRLRVIGSRLNSSVETIHQYFRIGLQAILYLYNDVIRPPDGTTPNSIQELKILSLL
ncbi:uncharacterized protein J3R85_011130 [Psidium guajava]|nr:uncharacterized protein J3R85_011130 [Psidium guajava]